MKAIDLTSDFKKLQLYISQTSNAELVHVSTSNMVEFDKAMDEDLIIKKVLTSSIDRLDPFIRAFGENYLADIPQWFSLYQAVSFKLQNPFTFGINLYGFDKKFKGILLYTLDRDPKQSFPNIINLGIIPLIYGASDISKYYLYITAFTKGPLDYLTDKYYHISWDAKTKSLANYFWREITQIYYREGTGPTQAFSSKGSDWCRFFINKKEEI